MAKGLYAQSPWASAVIDHRFGTSQTVGQDSAYFPANVLGPPAATANTVAPASAPEDVVSLGKGGYIVLAFDPPVIDGQGPDFVVFENAFYFGGSFVFDEWMTVAVSADGQTWHPYPTDTLTGTGFAGRIPTAPDSVNRLDPSVSGGDLYDLADLGLSEIRYIRLDDATHYQWDLARFQGVPRLSADLDAVGAIHQKQPSTVQADLPPPTRPFIQGHGIDRQLFCPIPLARLEVWNLTGQLLVQADALPAGAKVGFAPLPPAASILLVRAEQTDGTQYVFLMPW